MNLIFEGIVMYLSKDDVITSKSGILMGDGKYLVFKAKYLGKGKWKTIKKITAESKKVK